MLSNSKRKIPMRKQIINSLLALMLTGVFAVSCYGADKGSVYYLNYKPESDAAWQELAKVYTEKTGIPVKIETVANSQYTDVLNAKLNNADAPTLFQFHGNASSAEMEKNCFNLANSKVYKELSEKSYVLRDSHKRICGIAYAVETYGIIVNKELLAKAGYTVDDIESFEDLKAVAEDITARKNELGFSAFTSAGLNETSDWRFRTHLSNMPIYYEYQKKNVKSLNKIEGLYLNNYKAIWDLYINNSTCKPEELKNKGIEDSRNEFVSQKAVFYQNGSWDYNELMNNGMNKFKLAMIPLYVGAENEEFQGLCTGTDNYWCVNRNASFTDIKATLEFINWCVTSKEGTEAMAHKMGFFIPFDNAAYSENIFIQNNVIYTATGKLPVTWDFTTIPNRNWKLNMSAALANYSANQTDENWQKVADVFVNQW